MKRVKLPDGNFAQFPDEMSNDEIANVLNNQFKPQPAAQPQEPKLTFIFTAPDGKEYVITAPERATKAEILAYAKANYKNIPPKQKTQQQAQQPSATTGNASAPNAGDKESAKYTITPVDYAAFAEQPAQSSASPAKSLDPLVPPLISPAILEAGLLLGALLITLLLRFFAIRAVTKAGVVRPLRQLLWGYGIASCVALTIPPVAAIFVKQLPWSLGLTAGVPILGLFMLWDLRKAGFIDRSKTGRGINWYKGILRLWAIVCIPTFLIFALSEYRSQDIDKIVTGYNILLIPLGVIVALRWVLSGFRSTPPS